MAILSNFFMTVNNPKEVIVKVDINTISMMLNFLVTLFAIIYIIFIIEEN